MKYPALTELRTLAKKATAQNNELIKKLKKKTPKDLDIVVSELHETAFEEYDCLKCGNCCKSLGPRITDRDIEQVAKNLRIRPAGFVEKYLRIDEDNDYVFQSMPCPFIGQDNYCHIYSNRPKACREYPHTDRKKFYQLLDLSLKNTETCPIVFTIFEELKKKYLQD